MMHLVYNIGIRVFSFFVLLASWFNPKAKKLRDGQNAALKQLESKVDAGAEYVWFHAASLGEFEQGRPVIEQLKRLSPTTKILLTFYSPSGYEVRKQYPFADVVIYLPTDTPSNAVSLVNGVNIKKAIFIKYEFWPNFLYALNRKGVEVYSISSIFRQNQVFFKWYGGWYLNLLKQFTHLFVQDDDSKELLQTKGINHVTVSGDTRFDRVHDLCQQEKTLPLIEQFCENSKLIVAGSTWMQDEELLIQYLDQHPDVKLLLAPHEIHEAHIVKIESMLKSPHIRYSEVQNGIPVGVRCMVIDVIGILSTVYRYANVTYVGGGFGAGIHNTLEAAVYDVPVVFGPNFQKFKEARDLVELGAAITVNGFDELKHAFDVLLTDGSAGAIAGRYVQSKVGATDMIIQQLCK
jgi:3-deoxy-D-manno-octulosonic-acid transferase